MLSLDSPQLWNPAGGDGFEAALRRISLPGAVPLPQQVTVLSLDSPQLCDPAGGDGYKAALRRISPPGAVVTPAGDGVVAGQPATMIPRRR